MPDNLSNILVSSLNNLDGTNTRIVQTGTKLVMQGEDLVLIVQSSFMEKQLRSIMDPLLKEIRSCDENAQWQKKVDGVVIKIQADAFIADDSEEDLAEFEETPVVRKTHILPVEDERLSEIARLVNRHSLSLESDKTFPNFIASRQNLNSFKRAKSFANDEKKSLFIYGPVGMGKTHLMQAIAHNALAERPHSKFLYLQASGFTDIYFECVKSKKLEPLKNYFKELDFCLIDDIHTLKRSEKLEDFLFQVFNFNRSQNKWFVFTCDVPPTRLDEMAERLTSRFSEGCVLNLHAPDYTTQKGIIENRIKLYEKNNTPIPYDPKIVAKLSQIDYNNVRTLIGAFDNIWSYAEVLENPYIDQTVLDESNALEAIKEDKRLTTKHIIAIVSENRLVSVDDIMGDKRQQTIALARHICAYFIHELMELSLGEVARSLNKKDHTTADNSIKKVKTKMSDDYNFQVEMDQLRRLIVERN